VAEKRAVVYGKALAAVVVWGASFIVTKLALRDLAPMTVVWLRFMIGLPVLAVAMVRRRELALPAPRDMLTFAVLGFLGITFHQWLQANGLVTARATTTAWIVATIPVFIVLLGRFFLKEKLGWGRTIGIVLAALGVVLVVSRGDLKLLVSGQFGTKGDFLVLISAVNWALFSVLSRNALGRHPASRMMFYVMAFACLFNTFFFLAGPEPAELLRMTPFTWTAVAFLGLFCSGLAYIFWFDALKALPVSQAGAFLYIEPLVAMAVAAVVLKESMTIPSLAGGAVILLGVWLVNR
jgi:drug/metabolite transporter (DMT)-like permease